MKPTPTPEMIEAHAIADAKFAGMDFATLGRADKKRFLERAASCLSAALSVQPAAAVVGEPVAYRWKLRENCPWGYSLFARDDVYVCEPLYAALGGKP